MTAAHIKLNSDNQLNYNPQYDGYEWGTTIKQADTVLVSYPLLYPLLDEFKRNNLRFYENVTRADGPAMTWSMHTIGHLELSETRQADVLFRKSYQNYIRPPFMVTKAIICKLISVNCLQYMLMPAAIHFHISYTYASLTT